MVPVHTPLDLDEVLTSCAVPGPRPARSAMRPPRSPRWRDRSWLRV
ncbi:hypothetical protein T261_8554 [Streptomyces lydicus]|nr:hypothetical protein T261_8554 [Streptomyces lydicus]